MSVLTIVTDASQWVCRAGVVGAMGIGALVFAVGARAVTIEVGSATVERGDEAAGICVDLALDAGELVAGTENLLVWDGACATILPATCAANPAHGKDLTGSLQQHIDFRYKALVLSFTDTDPIPAGQLYCCDFLSNVATPGECCQLRVVSPGASDPDGNELSVASGAPGRLCLSSTGVPAMPTSTPRIATATPSPTVTVFRTATTAPLFSPTAPPSGATRTPVIEGGSRTQKPTSAVAHADDEGCAVGPTPQPGWMLLAPLVFVVLRRR